MLTFSKPTRSIGISASGPASRIISTASPISRSTEVTSRTLPRYIQETVDLERKQGGSEGSRGLAYCLAGLASVLAERGRTEDAAKLWGAICAAEDALGFRMLGFERRRYEQRLAQLETTPSWREGNALTLEEAHAAIG